MRTQDRVQMNSSRLSQLFPDWFPALCASVLCSIWWLVSHAGCPWNAEGLNIHTSPKRGYPTQKSYCDNIITSLLCRNWTDRKPSNREGVQDIDDVRTNYSRVLQLPDNQGTLPWGLSSRPKHIRLETPLSMPYSSESQKVLWKLVFQMQMSFQEIISNICPKMNR